MLIIISWTGCTWETKVKGSKITVTVRMVILYQVTSDLIENSFYKNVHPRLIKFMATT